MKTIVPSKLENPAGDLWYLVHTTTTGAQSDPEGGTTAVFMKEDSSAGAHEVTVDAYPTTPSGEETRLECWVKNHTGSRWFWMSLLFLEEGETEKDWYAFFKPSDGSRGTQFAPNGKVELQISASESGWYHLTLIVRDHDAEITDVSLGLSDVDDGLSYTGDGSSGVDVYGVRAYQVP